MPFDLFQQLARSAEVADVGHAGTDEHFVDLLALNAGQQASVIRIVRRAEHRLLDIGQIDFDDFSIFGIGVGRQQVWLSDPGFHRLSTAFHGPHVTVAFADHPAQQGDVGFEVLGDGFFWQLDGAASCRALSRGIGQFEGLLDGEFVQTFDFQDAAGEGIDLALFLDGQQAVLDAVIRNRVDQIAQGDARVQLALEAHQNRFRHIQRHDAGGSGKGNQARARRERDTDREAGVRVAAGADGVRQQHAVEPAVDDAVARTQ